MCAFDFDQHKFILFFFCIVTGCAYAYVLGQLN